MRDSVLVTLADRNFLNQAKQLFSSAKRNGNWKGEFALLAHNIPEKDLFWFRKNGVYIKKCPSLGLPSRKRKYPLIFLDKFYLFTPYFKQWKKVLDSTLVK